MIMMGMGLGDPNASWQSGLGVMMRLSFYRAACHRYPIRLLVARVLLSLQWQLSQPNPSNTAAVQDRPLEY